MKAIIDINNSMNDGLGMSKSKVKCTLPNGEQIQSDIELEVNELVRVCGRVSKEVEDFLFIASIIYTVDKMVSRKFGFDNWTRELDVTIPVQCSQMFNNISDKLINILNFLTGDIWTLSFQKFEGTLFLSNNRRPSFEIDSIGAVSLFSGGLDSLIGAIDWLETNKNEQLILVGHHDPKVPGPYNDQQNVITELKKKYKNRFVELLIRCGQNPTGKETTFRSRSLLFIALGVYAAASLKKEVKLYIPENGTIAINIPLTPSRRGTCSTRTTHPHYLALVGDILKSIYNKVILENPYAFSTKGESVVSCKNQDILKKTALLTRSCAKSGHTHSWRIRTAKNCGRCMPCIYRRAALNKIGLDMEQYGNDICNGDVSLDSVAVSTDDFRACVSFLNSRPADIEIAKAILTNGPVDLNIMDNYVDLVKRTREEVKNLISNKAINLVKRRIDIK